ncbi:MAG: stage III sporulation protein AE [Lachnospiraceae bacterium]|nr:stage III sporulation protein AE [Lachnospiraceae bacterium]
MKRWRTVSGFTLLILFLCLFPAPEVLAGKKDDAGGSKEEPMLAGDLMDWEDTIPLEEAQKAFENIQGTDSGFSLTEYVEEVINGKAEFSLASIWQESMEQLGEQFESQRAVIFRILALGLMAGVFMNFSGTIGNSELGETGFYLTFLLLFATLSAGFYTAYSVAGEAMGNLLDFMRALVPAFSLTLCLGMGTGTSIAYYETMLIAISMLEMVTVHIFLPGVQVYFLLSMINQLADNRFSRMAELIKSFLQAGIKILFAVLIGYQGIQGMLLPVMDKVKNNAMLQTAKGLPGVGNTFGGVADTLLGSGMLIKSAVGVGGLICIVVMCLYPLLKLLIFTLLHRAGGAIVQPVSDKRVVAALQAAAESGKLMLGCLFAGALMFLISIAIVVVSTNLVA